MDFSKVFIHLYKNVLNKEKNKFSVGDQDVRQAIQVMKEVYMPNPAWQMDQAVSVADYNDPAHRCAYIHKYALLYTDMVCDLLQQAIQSNDNIFEHFNSKTRLSLCSLGGGPGTDVIGSLAAFYACCEFIPCSVTILDYAKDWETTLSFITQELRNSPIKALRDMMSPQYFQCDYLDANLLSDVASKPAVRNAVRNADFLTMVKFISAAACRHTRKMVKDIFNCMKDGAMLLFIDNAAGRFQEMMDDVARQCGMITVFGPLRHYDYENPKYSIVRFGYTSQSKTKIAVQMWQKPQGIPYNTTQQLRREYFVQESWRAQGNENIRLNANNTPQRARPERNDGCCSLI